MHLDSLLIGHDGANDGFLVLRWSTSAHAMLLFGAALVLVLSVTQFQMAPAARALTADDRRRLAAVVQAARRQGDIITL